MQFLLRVVPWFIFVFAGQAVRAADDYVFHHENVMGTSLELRVTADNPASANRAESRVLGEIDRLSRIFSSYDPASEFRRWELTSQVKETVSNEVFDVLSACDRWRDLSGGAFDPRAEASSR